MDVTLVLELLLLCVLLGLSAFFSSSETSLFSLNRVQIEQMRRDGNPRVTLIERLLSQPRQLIVTILIGNELVNVAASVISAAIVIRLMGADSKWINLLIMVPLLLFVGEITPKTLAIRNNVAFAAVQSRLIDLFARLITPLRWVVRHIAELFITLIVGKERSRANILTEDMVRTLTKEALGQGVLDHEEALYINRIFDFGAKTLREIMTPRSRIFFLSAKATPREAAAAYRRSGHTKVPVYEGHKDTVVGIFYARDLLNVRTSSGGSRNGGSTVRDFMRDAYFVPESKSVSDLFYTFRKRKLSLALTVDEYGGVTGLVTMEDLLECIFGEILSRSELLQQSRVSVQKLAEGRYDFDGSITIDQFNRELRAQLDHPTVDTIGGLLLEAFGELPQEGQRIVLDGFEFTVVSVVDRRIAIVSVEVSTSADETEQLTGEDDSTPLGMTDRWISPPETPHTGTTTGD